MIIRKRFIVLLVIGAALLFLTSCGSNGGGGVTSSQSGGGVPGSGGGTTPSAPLSSSLFHVDVTTGLVTVTPVTSPGTAAPVSSKSPTPRAVFTGTSVTFNSSSLIDQPGNLGYKNLSVSLTNNWGNTIGALPNGTTTGLRVVFGPFTNVTGVTDIRSMVQVSTLAGTGAAGSVDGSTTSATFNGAMGVAAGDGIVYVSEYGGNRIRKISNGVVSTLAGSGVVGSADGVGTAASFTHPLGIAINPADFAVIVADYEGHRIRRVDSTGSVTLLAGTGVAGGTNGSGSVAQFNNPIGVAVDDSGAIYVSDSSGHRVRKIVLSGLDPRAASSYTVSTLAGSGSAGNADGVGTAAQFNYPYGLTVDPDGVVYVVDGSNRVRRVSPAGEVTSIAGTGAAGSANGLGNAATFNFPLGIAWVQGVLVVSDFSGQILRQVRLLPGGSPGNRASWEVRTLAGSAGVASYADGNGVAARFNGPYLVAGDGVGNVYVADYTNNRVRQVTPNGGFFPITVTGTSGTPTDNVTLGNPDGVVPGTALGTNRPYIQYPGSLAAGWTNAAKDWVFYVPAGVTAFEFTVQVEANTKVAVPMDAVDGNTSGGVGSPNVMVSTIAGIPNVPGFVDGPGSRRCLTARILSPRTVRETSMCRIASIIPYGGSRLQVW